MPHFLVFGCHSLVCTNDYIARLYSKIGFNISSGSYGVHAQVIQPFLKFPYKFPLINYILTRHSHHDIHLKECHLWPTLKGISQNTAFH